MKKDITLKVIDLFHDCEKTKADIDKAFDACEPVFSNYKNIAEKVSNDLIALEKKLIDKKILFHFDYDLSDTSNNKIAWQQDSNDPNYRLYFTVGIRRYNLSNAPAEVKMYCYKHLPGFIKNIQKDFLERVKEFIE